MKKVIWTAQARDFLFSALVTEFGPYESWETKIRPVAGGPDMEENIRYEEFLEAFSTIIGAKSGAAVDNQIRYAVMPNPPKQDGNLHVHHVNRHYAAKHGFIETEY